jgi:RHS repeat-associated protein
MFDDVFAGDLRVARVGGARTPALGAGLLRVPPLAGGAGLFALAFAGVLGLAGGRGRRGARGLTALGLCAVVLAGACRTPEQTGALTGTGVAGAIYLHHDHLGGVTVETDEHGEVLSESAFDPYGGDLEESRAPYAFTGQERDRETGLYDLGARAYDPRLGLFLTPDPAVLESPALAVEDPQLLAPYAYVRNNPAGHVDPDGRLPHLLAGALVGAAIGGGAYLIRAAFTHEELTWTGAFSATASGAVAGAVTAATAGASLFVEGVAAGAAGGITQRAIETRSLSETLDPKSIALDAALGAAGAAVGRTGTVFTRGATPAIKAALTRSQGQGLDLRYSQRTARQLFHDNGLFKGRTIDEVSADLRAGRMKPSDVPVKYVTLEGNNLIVNTRSSLALKGAGVPQSEWTLIESTAEHGANIQKRLSRNGLSTEGTDTLLITGRGNPAK